MTEQPPSSGYPPRQSGAQPPDNYLVWSILATVLCFPITGIVATVKAASVNGLWAQGRYPEAEAAVASAKKWVRWSVVIWVAGVIAYGVLLVVLVTSADHGNAAMLARPF